MNLNNAENKTAVVVLVVPLKKFGFWNLKFNPFWH